LGTDLSGHDHDENHTHRHQGSQYQQEPERGDMGLDRRNEPQPGTWNLLGCLLDVGGKGTQLCLLDSGCGT
jgi:hypothetical protein